MRNVVGSRGEGADHISLPDIYRKRHAVRGTADLGPTPTYATLRRALVARAWRQPARVPRLRERDSNRGEHGQPQGLGFILHSIGTVQSSVVFGMG